jgi:hypothetical protein
MPHNEDNGLATNRQDTKHIKIFIRRHTCNFHTHIIHVHIGLRIDRKVILLLNHLTFIEDLTQTLHHQFI